MLSFNSVKWPMLIEVYEAVFGIQADVLMLMMLFGVADLGMGRNA